MEPKLDNLAIIRGAMAEQGYPESQQLSSVARGLYANAPNFKGTTGKTALMYAAYIGALGRVQQLLDKGTNVNNVDVNGFNALAYAAMGEKSIHESNPDHSAVIRLLLKTGTNLEAQNNLGQTPLNIAAYNGNVEAVQILCAAGANTNTVDYDNQTPFLALLYRFINMPDKIPIQNVKDILSILLTHGMAREYAKSVVNNFVVGDLKTELLRIINQQNGSSRMVRRRKTRRIKKIRKSRS